MELATITKIVREQCSTPYTPVIAAAIEHLEHVAQGDLPLSDTDVDCLARRAQQFIDGHQRRFEQLSSSERQELVVRLLIGEDVSRRLAS